MEREEIPKFHMTLINALGVMSDLDAYDQGDTLEDLEDWIAFIAARTFEDYEYMMETIKRRAAFDGWQSVRCCCGGDRLKRADRGMG